MNALWLAAAFLGQTPAVADDAAPAEAPPTLLQVDLDIELAYVTTPGDYAHERGESVGGMATAWVAGRAWRGGLGTRVLNIANDPFGRTNPIAADLVALVSYRFWFLRLAVGPQLGGGVELFGGPQPRAGPALEAGLEGALSLTPSWTLRFRFAFTMTPTLEVSAYWRWSIGIEWSSVM